MKYAFDIEKVVQVVGYLIKVSGKRRMNFMKCLKLLYIADRESLREAGAPITGDCPVAMSKGPVLSQIYDLIGRCEEVPNKSEQVMWWERFFRTHDYHLHTVKQPGVDRLCQFEMDKLAEVWAEYGHMSGFALSDHTHTFSEWKKNEVGRSSSPIPLRDILEAVGRTDDVERAISQSHEDRHFARLFG